MCDQPTPASFTIEGCNEIARLCGWQIEYCTKVDDDKRPPGWEVPLAGRWVRRALCAECVAKGLT